MKRCDICKIRDGIWTIRKGIFVQGRFCHQCLNNRLSKQIKKYIRDIQVCKDIIV